MIFLLNKISNSCIAYLLIASLFVLAGCYNDKEALLYPGSNAPADCAIVPSKFAADVYPLITNKCAVSGCHDATASGGIILQNFTQINAKQDRINARALMEKSMPPTGPLLPADIDKIKCWISNGALND